MFDFLTFHKVFKMKPLDMVCQPGTYATVHFLGYDVFGDPQGICNYTELINLVFINMMIVF